MPRGRPKGSKNKVKAKTKGDKRGRKPIFSDEQKRLLERMIRVAMKAQLKGLVQDM